MKTTLFKSLYVVEANALEEDEDIAGSFLFQGSKNWDLYFLEALPHLESDKLDNVSLLEFDDKKEFENYMYNYQTLDYSLEHAVELNKYYALVDNGKD